MRSNNDTKQKLMNVTKLIIDNHGIESVSMREIGKETRLSRSAVYRHFNNKEDLLAAIVVENFQALKNSICTLINEVKEPEELINTLLYTYYDFGIKNREHYNLMFGREWNPEKYPDVYKSALEVFEIIANCLKKAQEAGCIIKKPGKELMAIIFSFIHGLVELNFSGHSETEKGLDDPYGLINSFLSLIKV